MKFTLHADGSSLGNGARFSKGGWAFILVGPDGKEMVGYGSASGATNNQMELTSVIEGLKIIPDGCFVDVHSDSRYVIDGASLYIRNWVKRGWKGVKNPELWKSFIQVCGDKRLKWTWVKGHSDCYFNNKCDRLAKSAAERIPT